MKKYVYSLAFANAYEVYRELFGEPPETDTEMTECMTMRNKIAHDRRLLTKNECDKYLKFIEDALQSAKLIG